MLIQPQDPREPTPDEHSGNPTTSRRLHKRSDSQNPPLLETGGDVSKRRSFLPQRGLPKSFTKPGAVGEAHVLHTRPDIPNPEKTSNGVASERAGTGDSKPGRLRPRSLYQTRASQQDQSAAVTDGFACSSRLAGANSKPPASAGLSRSQSLRRPVVAAQPATAVSTRTHARTQSTHASIGARKDTTEGDKSASRAERPKSLLVATGHTKPSTNVSAEAAHGIVRTSARLDAMKRSASTRSKPGISQSRVPSSTLVGAEEHPQADEARAVLRNEPRKLARPAFSTLQQHFTPKKTGKAHISTFLHATAEPANQFLAPDVISLQNELLQLCILHESSTSIQTRWELSAQQTLKTIR
ncbi:hypothetical protein N0V90_008357 [Kalmusia sp. IMI 367209]|nr:hypothetical protein N0V90_008357 [Kalmusia sp. IMI 367209]